MKRHIAIVLTICCMSGASAQAQTTQPPTIESVATPAAAGKAAPARAKPADAALCARKAAERMTGTATYESWILFNTAGAACYVPYPLRQRDTLRFAVVVAQGEPIPDSVAVNLAGCTLPTPGPVVLSSGSIPEVFTKQSTGEARTAVVDMVMEAATRVACGSGAPVAASSIVYAGQAPVTQNTTLSLYERHTATVHLGVLNSKLRDPDFTLRASGGQNVISDKEATDRGPQYVAMVVVQAIPRYFRSGGLSYPGRDLQHDMEPADRLGLVLSFGIKDPAKRFGVGASYEIAKGINVVAVREWVKRSELDGVRVGDAFTGTASDIPTRKAWGKGWSLGLSFDIGYITSVFGGGK